MTVSGYQIEEDVRAVHADLVALQRTIMLAAEDLTSAKDAANAMASLHALKQFIRDLYEQYEEQALKVINEPIRLESGALVEKRTGQPRKKWQHAAIGEEVANRIVLSSYDMDTGELVRSKEEMIGELLKYAAPGYWRVKELAKIGVDANKYCELGDPKDSIVITTSKEDAL